MKREATLIVEKVTKLFDGVKALDEFSFSIEAGTIVGLIGPNGAGKSTLLDLISGFLRPTRGQLFFHSREITHLSIAQISSLGIARTFQITRVARALSALENMVVASPWPVGMTAFSAMRTLPQTTSFSKYFTNAEEILRSCGLSQYASTPAAQLSYGEQKLLALGMLLARDANLLLLDEPVTGVSPPLREKIAEMLLHQKRKGKSVLLIEHDISTLKLMCDNVVMLVAGQKVLEGQAAEVFSSPLLAERLWNLGSKC